MANASQLRVTSGQLSFSAGVDSSKPASAASEVNPLGLKSNQLSWLANGVVRGGSISNRPGFQNLSAFTVDIGILQEAKFYKPDLGFPYVIAQIGGRTFIIHTDTDNSIVEITIPGDPNPPAIEQSWMCQAECFMIIQDGVSVPLVWDGTTLRRVTSMANASPKIPTATCMCYYQGRLALAKGRDVMISDIVKGPSGTGTLQAQLPDYGKRDSVLSVVENTFELGGGVITMPSNDGNIRALDFSANIDAQLGQGTLFAFTMEAIYSINIVPTRAEWIAQTEPIVKVACLNYGCVSDRSIVKINGDLFFQTPLGVMSLTQAIRNFSQWGNTPISAEEARVLAFNNRALLRFSSGIQFDNRCLQTVLPIQTPVGVANLGLMPLDFDLISTLSEKLPPAWEGMWEGLDFLRLLDAEFGGRPRAFSLVHSRVTGGVEFWEISQGDLTDNGDNRITRVIEFPSLDVGSPFELKNLDVIELWVDRISGTVDFTFEYRENQNPCWHPLAAFQKCYARNSCENIGVLLPCTYPQQPYSQGYFATLVTPQAKPDLCDTGNNRPTNIAYAFQIKLTTKGSNRVRGYAMHMFPRDKSPYTGIVC